MALKRWASRTRTYTGVDTVIRVLQRWSTARPGWAADGYEWPRARISSGRSARRHAAPMQLWWKTRIRSRSKPAHAPRSPCACAQRALPRDVARHDQATTRRSFSRCAKRRAVDRVVFEGRRRGRRSSRRRRVTSTTRFAAGCRSRKTAWVPYASGRAGILSQASFLVAGSSPTPRRRSAERSSGSIALLAGSAAASEREPMRRRPRWGHGLQIRSLFDASHRRLRAATSLDGVGLDSTTKRRFRTGDGPPQCTIAGTGTSSASVSRESSARSSRRSAARACVAKQRSASRWDTETADDDAFSARARRFRGQASFELVGSSPMTRLFPEGTNGLPTSRRAIPDSIRRIADSRRDARQERRGVRRRHADRAAPRHLHGSPLGGDSDTSPTQWVPTNMGRISSPASSPQPVQVCHRRLRTLIPYANRNGGTIPPADAATTSTSTARPLLTGVRNVNATNGALGAASDQVVAEAISSATQK